ncbi:MAG: ABC transporter permease [Burkholderiales bacterium]|nr:ABC transporter permease [Burkholderiales bacterium]
MRDDGSLRAARAAGVPAWGALSVRWRKLWRDVIAERRRYALMLAAVAVSVAAFGTVLGTRDVLQREMARNYLGTAPAHATLELPGGVSDAALALARADVGVEQAEAGDVLSARVRIGVEWRALLLFVVDDFRSAAMNRATPVAGAYPPPPGQALVERTAVSVLGAGVGAAITVKLPGAAAAELRIAGVVHDPSLAPAWQEQSGYAYVDRATLRRLAGGAAPNGLQGPREPHEAHEPHELHELRVRFQGIPEQMAAVQAAAQALAQRLTQAGMPVAEVRVPPPRRHPHQRQMETVLLLLLGFGALALLLSSVLTANALAALLARQTREIAVMKTLGARTGQLVAMYTVLVLGIGAVALLFGVPAAALGGAVFARAVATLLNLSLASEAPAAATFVVQALAALGVPLAIAALPIGRACRAGIRLAMDRHGVAGTTLRRVSAQWPVAWRNLARRPGRLVLTLGLLAAGGAMFMTALNVSASWELTVDKVYATRHYDVEIRSAEGMPPSFAERVRALPGVRAVESWGYAPAAFARPAEVPVTHVYPDRGHGSLAVMAPPAATAMVSFPVLRGRWLAAHDAADAVVLNHAAAAQMPTLALGDPVWLAVDGRATRWTLVGVVEEVGAAGVAYVGAEGFGRTARVLRIATDARERAERAQRIRQLDDALTGWGATVQSARPLSELRTAMGDHILILIRALMALAAVMAVVGGLGLASTLSVSVLERTRELAVMKTLGATPGQLTRMILSEARAVAFTSALGALLLSLPLTALLDERVGKLGFVAPLPFAVSPAAALGWLLGVLALSWVAGWLPARAAGRASIAVAMQAV